MKVNRFLYWTPRILSICFALFLMLFSFDVISPELTFWQIALGLFMHNIPALILLGVAIISWKHEIVGGITFIFAGFLYMFLVFFSGRFEWYMISWSFIISGPAFLIGILFLINWVKKKKIKLDKKR